jgi:hypothetical protein
MYVESKCIKRKNRDYMAAIFRIWNRELHLSTLHRDLSYEEIGF